MLCDRCKMKEAKIYYTEITGGKKIEQHLCEDCAAELTSFQKEIPLESLLSGLLGMGSGGSRNHVCQVCGMSYQEFQKAGKFGCENCYKTFGRLHQGTLKRIQGATAHTGKIAASWQQEQAERQQEYSRQEREAKQTEAIQGDGEHILKETEKSEPSRNEKPGKTEPEWFPLEQALKEAIAKEEYEEAARLRDEIRSIKASKDVPSFEKGGYDECPKNS